MTGTHSPARRRAPERRVARCGSCRQVREGITTFETMRYGQQPVGRPIHFCDDCDAAIVERPLEDVLSDYLAGSAPIDL